MHRKKLITVAAFAAILACGACFLPPPTPHRPRPRPRPRVNLQGSERIRVDAVSNSATHHLDPVMLKRCIADSLNLRRPPGIPAAAVDSQTTSHDALLTISIEKEDAAPHAQQLSPGSTTWNFDVTLSASLERPDGVLEWKGDGMTYHGVIVTADGGDPWNSAALAARAHYYICDPLADAMFSGAG